MSKSCQFMNKDADAVRIEKHNLRNKVNMVKDVDYYNCEIGLYTVFVLFSSHAQISTHPDLFQKVCT